MTEEERSITIDHADFEHLLNCMTALLDLAREPTSQGERIDMQIIKAAYHGARALLEESPNSRLSNNSLLARLANKVPKFGITND